MQRLPLPGPRANPEFAQREMNLRDILERWAGSDETLRVVMLAKSEEDKLKQEVMRLEVRRAEIFPHGMLFTWSGRGWHGRC